MAKIIRPDPQQQLNGLLDFLGIDSSISTNLQWSVRPSARWLELYDIEPDDPRFDAAQAELEAMTADQRDVRTISWDQFIYEDGLRGKLHRQTRVRLIPAVE